MDKAQVEWAMSHDWYYSHEQYAGNSEHDALYQIWAKENGEAMHPWPFRSFSELKRWAGY